MERLLELFAGLLEYPGPGLHEMVSECERTAAVPEAARGLQEFRRFVEATPPERLEEEYTAAFDLGAERCPYVGYHLFGDGCARSAFLQQLKSRFRDRGLETGSELPDHLSYLLRFASACGPGQEREEIVREAILPALQRMTAGQPDAYTSLLEALAAVLAGG
jgi:nitrate reductase delta subunit